MTPIQTEGRDYRGSYRFVRYLHLSLVISSLLLGLTRAQEIDPVDAGKEGLSSAQKFPWYDAENDDLRQVDVEAEATEVSRFDWTWESSAWSPNFSFMGQLLEALAWLLLVSLIAWLIYLMMRAYLNRDAMGLPAGVSSDLREEITDRQRIENLPFQVRRPQADFLATARQHYEAGNFAEAMIYLFSYQLLQLDKANLIRLAKGKTNRQYLHELSPHHSVHGLVTHSMVAFEDVFFGHHPLDRQRFESCWNHLDEFHQLIQA